MNSFPFGHSPGGDGNIDGEVTTVTVGAGDRVHQQGNDIDEGRSDQLSINELLASFLADNSQPAPNNSNGNSVDSSLGDLTGAAVGEGSSAAFRDATEFLSLILGIDYIVGGENTPGPIMPGDRSQSDPEGAIEPAPPLTISSSSNSAADDGLGKRALRCPNPSCEKVYTHPNSLRYHLTRTDCRAYYTGRSRTRSIQKPSGPSLTQSPHSPASYHPPQHHPQPHLQDDLGSNNNSHYLTSPSPSILYRPPTPQIQPHDIPPTPTAQQPFDVNLFTSMLPPPHLNVHSQQHTFQRPTTGSTTSAKSSSSSASAVDVYNPPLLQHNAPTILPLPLTDASSYTSVSLQAQLQNRQDVESADEMTNFVGRMSPQSEGLEREDSLPAAGSQGSGRLRYACKVCRKIYKNLGGLKYHHKTVHMDLDFQKDVKEVV